MRPFDPVDTTVAVIIPAFDEAPTIVSTIEQLRADLAVPDVEFALYVIDDGSTDGTADLAPVAGADRVVGHPTNLGLGAAVRTALEAARPPGRRERGGEDRSP